MNAVLTITPEKHIYEVQAAFNGYFPFLNLSFFNRPHRKGEMSPTEFLIDSGRMLDDISDKKHWGSITIQHGMTVAELEHAFKQRFGLSVQVFRKCGSIWLETTATDGWSLDDQNREGQALTELHARTGSNENTW